MPARSFNLAVLRLAEINKLCRHRYGGFGELPDDDSGRHDLHVLIHHHALLHSNVVRMRNIIAAKAPWMDSVEAGELIQDACRSPRKWTADQLAMEMGLTEADRRRLRIRTIGAIDVSSEQRRQAKRLRDRDRQRKHRRAKGMKARTATSIEQTKPWLALGISRRTWYRKQNGTEVSHIMPDRHAQAWNTQCKIRVTKRLLATRYGHHFRAADSTDYTFHCGTGVSHDNKNYMA